MAPTNYDCGIWAPVYHGLKFRLARKGERFAILGSHRTSETDPSQTFATLAEAQAAADARNANAIWFRVDGALFTAAQMREANADDADLLGWLGNAQVGDRFAAFVPCERVA